MDPLPIARQAARSILRRSGAWSDQDYEDAEQEAAVHIVQAMRRRPDAPAAYLAGAAMSGVREWMVAQARNRCAILDRAHRELDGQDVEQRGFHDGRPWIEPLNEVRAHALIELLASARGSRRTAARDVGILALLSRGMTQKEIGEELNMSRWQISVYRQRIRKVLQENCHVIL